MSFISKQQRAHGPAAVAAHPDFNLPWIKRLLSDDQMKWADQVPTALLNTSASNNMFENMLTAENDAIHAHLSFYRPSRESDAITGWEECWLLSIGAGVDGATGRTHGGFNTLVLDQISGSVAQNANPQPYPPATATITVDFKAEVRTPCVILLRAWIFEHNGRKVWVRSVLEDGTGKVCTMGKALFVAAKNQPPKL